MKKEKKFLNELREKLGNISEKDKDVIVLKYENIIKERKEAKERIVDILKNIGKAEDVANKEIEEYKSKNSFKYKFNNFLSKFKNFKKKVKKDKPKKNKKSFKEIITGIKSNYSNNKKPVEKSPFDKFVIKVKDSFNKIKEEEKNKGMKSFVLYRPDDKKESSFSKIIIKIKESFNKLKNKENKNISLEKTSDKKGIKLFFAKFKRHKKEETKEIEEIPNTEEEVEEIEDTEIIEEDIKNELVDVNEIIPEKEIFETKGQRIKRRIFNIINVIFSITLLFIWLWITVVFVASIFAFLDGVKFYGLVITLGGLDLLMVSIIVLINKSLFNKRISRKWSFIFILFFIVVMAVGIALGLKQIYELEITTDVSEKYNMTKKNSSYNLPSDINKKLYISFNSNYHTEYIIDYDETISDKVNIEVKYYECYYDYYSKKDNNNLYISLKLDRRDRLSVYIDDFKEGKIYDNDELERYVVKITINENDKDRIAIK